MYTLQHNKSQSCERGALQSGQHITRSILKALIQRRDNSSTRQNKTDAKKHPQNSVSGRMEETLGRAMEEGFLFGTDMQ